jgi:hypothetical protein
MVSFTFVSTKANHPHAVINFLQIAYHSEPLSVYPSSLSVLFIRPLYPSSLSVLFIRPLCPFSLSFLYSAASNSAAFAAAAFFMAAFVNR